METNINIEVKKFISRLEDKADLVTRNYIEQVTEFVDPFLCRMAKEKLKSIPDINYMSFGGVEDAERQRIIICPDYEEPRKEMAQICLLKLTGKLNYVNVSHRDFLGALLALGIKREKVGDIYPTDDGFVVSMSEELSEYIIFNPPKIKGVPLSGQKLSIGSWQPPRPEGKEVNVSLASLRLDAVVANGFGLSRTKVSEEIKKGRVKVNWQVIQNSDYKCNEEDVISFRGKGRIIITKISGITQKKRIKTTITRFR